jgi:hypothetical protein
VRSGSGAGRDRYPVSAEWQARFEIVAGPNDGLTFAVTDTGVVLDGELLGPPPGLGLAPKDLDDVEVEVGDEGVKLTCEVPFWLNGVEVSGTHPLNDGDIVRVGMTEMMLVGHSSGPTHAVVAEDGSPGGVGPAPRKCLRPGCGAVNPPDAMWCRTCGWDLESPE